MSVILFLKAVVKKRIWVPNYSRKDGTVVDAHYAMVNVAIDHDQHKVISGKGTDSQQKAHKELAGKGDWNRYNKDEQEAILLHHGTTIQDNATRSALATFAKQKIIAGSKPSKREWASLHELGDSSHLNHLQAIHDAGKSDAYYALHDEHGTQASVKKSDLKSKLAAHEAAKAEKKSERRPKGSNRIDPEHDSLLTAIAKLGGLDKSEAKAQGIDPAYFNVRGHGIKRVFHTNGATFDDLAHNYLSELGYPVTGANDLLEAIDRELSGDLVFTPEGYANNMDREHYDDNAQTDDADIEDYGIDTPVYDASEYEGMDEQAMADYDLYQVLEFERPGAYNELYQKSKQEGDNAEQFNRRCQGVLHGISGEVGRPGATGAQEVSGGSAVGQKAKTKSEGEGRSVGAAEGVQGEALTFLDGKLLQE